MNTTLLSFTTAVLLLVACRHQESASQLKSINQSLQQSNTVVQNDNRFSYGAMVTKLKDPLTSSEAAIWAPRAEMVKKQVDSINILIENLKAILLRQSDSLRMANAPLVEHLNETNGDGYTMLNKLVAFKESIPRMLNIKDFSDEPYLVNELKRDLPWLLDTIPLLPGFRDSLPETQGSIYKKKWVEENFAGSTSLLTMMQLNRIKSEVLVTERILVTYFLSQIKDRFLCVRSQAIAVLDSKYVKSGQTIEVTAGIGQFTGAPYPTVIIDGKEIKLNSDFVAEYSFKANGKPGKHSIKVTFEYARADGEKTTIWKNLEYIIAEN